MLIALLLQAAPAPDIELNIHARARSVEIQQRGQAKLVVTAEPDGGSEVRSEVTPRAEGRTRLRNVDVHIRAEIRIADPQQKPAEPETPPPQ